MLWAVKYSHPPKVTRLILQSVIKIFKIHQDKLPFLLKQMKTHLTTHHNSNKACAQIHIISKPLMTRNWPKGRGEGNKPQSYKKNKSNYWTSNLIGILKNLIRARKTRIRMKKSTLWKIQRKSNLNLVTSLRNKDSQIKRKNI